ncbi:MAG: nucleoside-diphosphate sugar epimerase/dehydratase [SAR86 cluster bacterium]|jgi:FlaA1/EpsC-like NDP-sugar epimerase|nr:nucleoside-diphosphate sugar epimerase/dehydratase [SAR86 cluster bacterium]
MKFSYKTLAKYALQLNRLQKNLIVAFVDYFSLVASLWISLSLVNKVLYSSELGFIFIVPLFALFIFLKFDLYRSVIRFISFRAFWEIVKALLLFIIIIGITSQWIEYLNFLDLSVLVIYLAISLLATSSIRMFASSLFSNQLLPSSRVIIYGAGSAGLQLATALKLSKEMKPVGFIDEDLSSQRTFVNGLEVFSPNKLEELITKKNVQEVLIAIPSASRSVLKRILKDIEKYPVKVRVLPGVAELALGKVSVSELKEVEIEDLLGREVAKPNKELLEENIKNKVVLVTGAGGSIGSELSRQIIKYKPSVLVLFEISEYSIYLIEKELKDLKLGIPIIPIIGSVVDKNRLIDVFTTFKVSTIYHAAAYKHVPLVEMNTIEGIKNNIFGTMNCVQAAIEAEVDTFVLISTDKAVRPTNVMGATKRISELILQALSAETESKEKKTLITMVRFGNVLDSAGSVVPLFRQQLRNGGPLTVTHEEVTRYFMSIPEAAELVIQAGAMAKGGEVFVLDMGEQIKIIDLAKRMIRLSGLEVKDLEHPDGDIEIEITGLRYGEKLYEELWLGNKTSPTKIERISQAQENKISWEKISSLIEDLNSAIQINDQNLIRKILVDSSADYTPDPKIHDLLHSQKVEK